MLISIFLNFGYWIYNFYFPVPFWDTESQFGTQNIILIFTHKIFNSVVLKKLDQ